MLPVDEAIRVAGRMARALTKAPLSVDIENGYSDDPKKVAQNSCAW
jgi:2-methylisocitrate lyase-like PEP mutase family enzyme